MEATCGGCRWMRKDDAQMNAFYCALNPPTPFPIQQGHSFGVAAIRPPVSESTPGCSHWTARPLAQ